MFICAMAGENYASYSLNGDSVSRYLPQLVSSPSIPRQCYIPSGGNINNWFFNNAAELDAIINRRKAEMQVNDSKTFYVTDNVTNAELEFTIKTEKTESFANRTLKGDVKYKVTLLYKRNGEERIRLGAYKSYGRTGDTKARGHAINIKKVQKEIEKEHEEFLEKGRQETGNEFFGEKTKDLKDERDALQAERMKKAAKLEKKAKGSKGNKAARFRSEAEKLKNTPDRLEKKLNEEIAKRLALSDTDTHEFENQLREGDDIINVNQKDIYSEENLFKSNANSDELSFDHVDVDAPEDNVEVSGNQNPPPPPPLP
jgi:hypothetical protein